MPRVIPKRPKLVETIEWAAQQLGISKETAYRLARAGRLPGAFQLAEGGPWKVSVARLERFLDDPEGRKEDTA